MANLLTNGDFESGVAGWDLYVSGGNIASFLPTSDAYSGVGAGFLQVTDYVAPEPDGYVALQSVVNAVNGQSYPVSIRYKSTVAFRLMLLNQGGDVSYVRYVDCPASADWTQASFTADNITVPDGSITWIDLRMYSAGDVTIDEAIVESAVSPPTGFGYPIIGSLIDTKPVGWTNAVRAIADQTGLISEIQIYLRTDSGGNAKAVCYADNAGAPGALIAVSSQVAVGSSLSWVRFPVASGNVVSGTPYWLAWFGDVPLYTAYDENGAPNSHQAAPDTIYPNAPNPFPTPTWLGSEQFSIYAVVGGTQEWLPVHFMTPTGGIITYGINHLTPPAILNARYGDELELQATPNEGNTFLYWVINGVQAYTPTITWTVHAATTIEAFFNIPTPPPPPFRWDIIAIGGAAATALYLIGKKVT